MGLVKLWPFSSRSCSVGPGAILPLPWFGGVSYSCRTDGEHSSGISIETLGRWELVPEAFSLRMKYFRCQTWLCSWHLINYPFK